MIPFTVIESFDDRDKDGNVLSRYTAGQTYHIRDGNTVLASKVGKWQEEKKVVLGSPPSAPGSLTPEGGTVEGTGSVG